METGEVLAPGVNAVQNVGEDSALACALATTLHVQELVNRALVVQLKLELATSNSAQVRYLLHSDSAM